MKKLGIGFLCMGLLFMNGCANNKDVDEVIQQGFAQNDATEILEWYTNEEDQNAIYQMETKLKEAFKDENVRVLDMSMEALKESNYAAVIFQDTMDVKAFDTEKQKIGILQLIYNAPNGTIDDEVDAEAKKLEETLRRRFTFEVAKKRQQEGDDKIANQLFERLLGEANQAYDDMLANEIMNITKD